MARLKTAFPKMENGFFSLLTERLKSNHFSGKRLKDAINHVIDNFQYKELTVADIVRFDRRQKLYTYSEVCSMVTKGAASFDDFKIVEIDGTAYRVMKKESTLPD